MGRPDLILMASAGTASISNVYSVRDLGFYISLGSRLYSSQFRALVNSISNVYRFGGVRV